MCKSTAPFDDTWASQHPIVGRAFNAGRDHKLARIWLASQQILWRAPRKITTHDCNRHTCNRLRAFAARQCATVYFTAFARQVSAEFSDADLCCDTAMGKLFLFFAPSIERTIIPAHQLICMRLMPCRCHEPHQPIAPDPQVQPGRRCRLRAHTPIWSTSWLTFSSFPKPNTTNAIGKLHNCASVAI